MSDELSLEEVLGRGPGSPTEGENTTVDTTKTGTTKPIEDGTSETEGRGPG